jgi:hypothetical protein
MNRLVARTSVCEGLLARSPCAAPFMREVARVQYRLLLGIWVETSKATRHLAHYRHTKAESERIGLDPLAF